MAVIARLAEQTLDPTSALADFTHGREADGAIASFIGLVRARDDTGAPLSALTLDWFPGLTEHSLEEIGAEALARFDVSDILIVHRVGRVGPGEPIVLAAAAAAHRRAAFQAVDYLMDRLKTDAAFWKREDGADGSHWIEPRASDRADRARWSS